MPGTNEQEYKDHLCTECGKSFKMPYELKKHVEVVHIKSSSHMCQFCGEGFVLKYKLKYHMALKHGFKKDYQCDLCNSEFITSVRLYVHKRKCTGPGKYDCKKCPNVYKKSSSLKNHYDRHRGKTYDCDECEKKFRYATSLNEHTLVKHLKPLSNACEICFKTYSRRNSIKVHMIGHTGADMR